MIYTIENENIKASINSCGAELTGLVNKATGAQLMWNADAEYWNRVSPVLFPFIGKLKGQKYTHGGVTYTDVPQHGWARDCQFEPESQSDDEIWFSIKSDDKWKARYPFDFKLTIGYVLKGARLDIIWKIANMGECTMHYSIGAHPAFMCRGGHDGWRLKFDGVKDNIVSRTLNSDGVFTEEMRNIPMENDVLKLYNGLFDRDALVLDSQNIHKICVVNPESKAVLAVHFDTPQLGIWTKGGKNTPFICIEPWYGRADRANFDGELKDRDYGNDLSAGDTDTKIYSIEVL